ncbi:MAG: REP-associated tyrosine transposase [Acidobacteriota bacterium]|jgi:putative transposase|nr:REP-associated tyrosine transposase [Acidobacteriota bacterium]
MVDWPHAPPHRFGDAGSYFITGSTLRKRHIFSTPAALDALQALLFTVVRQYDCWLSAWCLLSNHYHLVLQGEGTAIRAMLTRLHSVSGQDANAVAEVGRVWFQFRDTQLTFEQSWLARLRYTHENAVHHGLVRSATDYRWCSAAWFEATAKQSFVETVNRMKIDRVKIYDDF